MPVIVREFGELLLIGLKIINISGFRSVNIKFKEGTYYEY